MFQKHNQWLKPTGIEILDEQVPDDERALELPSESELC
jgi:hypothetical protein